MSIGRRCTEASVLLTVALACGGCSRGRSVVQVTLDMDSDRWELPHTAERVTLRRSDNMVVRVRLVNSSDRPVTVEKYLGRNISGIDHSLLKDGEMLSLRLPIGMPADFRNVLIQPGQSDFHDIELTRYTFGSDEPLPAGHYRLRLMYRMRDLKRELEKWVELEIK